MPSPNVVLCQHLRANGNRCGSPALRGQQFCYYHHPTRRPARPKTTAPVPLAFERPPIFEPEDVQIAPHEIMTRVANATLDVKRANLLLECVHSTARCLQAASRSYPGPDFGPDSTQIFRTS